MTKLLPKGPTFNAIAFGVKALAYKLWSGEVGGSARMKMLACQ
jgi:hypothetical protein